MNRIAFASLALFSLAAAACSSITGTEQERRRAIIDFGPNHPVMVEVPATATRGVAFEVAITSYGGGCISKAETEVRVSGMVATVEPYQLVVEEEQTACPDVLRTDRNVAQVSFANAGTARIVFRGLRHPSGETITVERTVAVQ